MTERTLLSILCLTAICLWLPALSPPEPPGSWARTLQRQLLIFPSDRRAWLQVEDRGPATGRKHIKVTLPAAVSLKITVQFAPMDFSGFWRNHPEVQQVQLDLKFRSPRYDLPPLTTLGIRDTRSIRWITHASNGDYEQKMFWLDPAQVTLPGLQARLKTENWGANKSDGIYASTQQHAYWNGHGDLNQYLKQAATPAKREFQLLLFQGPDLDDTLLSQRARGAMEAGAVCHLWDLQSSWYQRCQDGMFLDFKKLGKEPNFSGLPWDQKD